MRKEILEITRTQQYTDSNLVPVQIGVQPKSKARTKTTRTQGTNRPRKKRRRSEKVLLLQRGRSCKVPEQDETESNSRPSSMATDAPLADDHVTMYLVTVPHVKRSSCARVKIETTMRSDAVCPAPTGTERAKIISAIPTCETCLTTDTCAGGGICPRGSDKPHRRTQRWQQRNS